LNDLIVDEKRNAIVNSGVVGTGVYIRAKVKREWQSVDIYSLDAPSLLEWLRSRGGENVWAENTVGSLLAHKEPISKKSESVWDEGFKHGRMGVKEICIQIHKVATSAYDKKIECKVALTVIQSMTEAVLNAREDNVRT